MYDSVKYVSGLEGIVITFHLRSYSISLPRKIKFKNLKLNKNFKGLITIPGLFVISVAYQQERK